MRCPAAGWRLAAALAAVLAAALPSAAADKSFHLSLAGGLHPVFAFGQVEDYRMGDNDFPVTPYHQPVWGGLALGWSAGRWLFELDARWGAPSPVTLEDPSDGDALSIETQPRLSGTLGVFFKLLKRSFQPYIGAAAGVDAVLGGEVRAVSQYGYTIVLPEPALKDRFDPLVAAGGGVFIKVSGWLALRLDGRYVWVFEKGSDRPLGGVQAGAGLTVSF